MFSLFRTPSWPGHVRNAAFIDDARVLLTDGAGNVWQAHVASDEMTLMHPGASVLAPFTDRMPTVQETAKGHYPQIASSRDGSSIVVNTHDLALVSTGGTSTWSPLVMQWGLYYPKLQFSPYLGEEFILVQAEDWTLVFHSVTGELVFEAKEFSAGAWHPYRPQLLVIDHIGQLSWIEFGGGKARPDPRPIGKIGEDVVAAGNFFDPSDLIVLSDTKCIIENEQYLASIDLLSLKTDQIAKIGRDSYLLAYHSCGHALVVIDEDAWVWDLLDLKPRQKISSSVGQAFFSPSGKYLLTFDPHSTNPYPLSSMDALRKASIWKQE